MKKIFVILRHRYLWLMALLLFSFTSQAEAATLKPVINHAVIGGWSTQSGSSKNATDGDNATLVAFGGTGSYSWGTRKLITQYFLYTSNGTIRLELYDGTTLTYSKTFASGNTVPTATYTIDPPVYATNMKLVSTSGSWSNLAEIELYEDPPPPPPSNVTISKGTVTETTVDLTFSATDASSIELYKNGAKLVTFPGTATSYKVSGLTASTSYDFYIKAINIVGSANSSTLTVRTNDPPPPPPPPSNVTIKADSVTEDTVNLSFTATGASNIELYRNGVKVVTLAGDTTTFKDANKQPSTSYQYYIRAVNTGGATASEIITVKTLDPPPPVLSELSYTATTTSATVTWKNGKAPFTVVWAGTSTTTSERSFKKEGLTKNTSYPVTVTDSDGVSQSTTVKTLVKDFLQPPVPPDSTNIFQRMVNSFGTAGTYALVVIGAAVSLGIIEFSVFIYGAYSKNGCEQLNNWRNQDI
ncbi:fibronectin type III domain-containing protein (plasmid) [Brevibacillus fluminis]|uniref:fibronectin type III domain-containing protein n=1 Tax=Brevibacillus fluminis TaxID=511487 RepID=UPI003F8A461E